MSVNADWFFELVANHTCDVHVATATTDGYGQPVYTWSDTPSYVGVTTRFQEISWERMTVLSNLAIVADHDFWFESGSEIAEVLKQHAAEKLIQFRNVRARSNIDGDTSEIIDAGPFSASHIRDMAGRGAVFHVIAKRVG